MFVTVGVPVYEGQVVGECPKAEDITLNPCKEKHLTAVRSTGADEKLLLTPPVIFSLEEAIEFIAREGSRILGIPLRELSLKKDVLIAGIIRSNKVIVPNGNDVVERSDSVIVVTTNRFFRDLDDILQERR